jgi:hypothetical protein
MQKEKCASKGTFSREPADGAVQGFLATAGAAAIAGAADPAGAAAATAGAAGEVAAGVAVATGVYTKAPGSAQAGVAVGSLVLPFFCVCAATFSMERHSWKDSTLPAQAVLAAASAALALAASSSGAGAGNLANAEPASTAKPTPKLVNFKIERAFMYFPISHVKQKWLAPKQKRLAPTPGCDAPGFFQRECRRPKTGGVP